MTNPRPIQITPGTGEVGGPQPEPVVAYGLDEAIAAEMQRSGSAIETQLNATFVSHGTTDPGTTLPAGTPYIWYKTDGAGTVLDIMSGVA